MNLTGFGVGAQAAAFEQEGHSPEQDQVLKLTPEQFLEWKHAHDTAQVGPGSMVGYVPTAIKGIQY